MTRDIPTQSAIVLQSTNETTPVVIVAAVSLDKSTPPYGSGIMDVPTDTPENFIPFEEL